MSSRGGREGRIRWRRKCAADRVHGLELGSTRLKLAPLVVSGVIVVVDQVEGEGERAGEWQSAAHVGSPIGALGWLWRVCEGAAGGRRRRGTRPWRLADVETR